MSSVRYPLVGGEVMRVTRVDRCGRPSWGEKATVTSEGFVSVAVTANYDDGEEVSVTNARGKKCVQRDAEPELLNLGVTVVYCDVDPELYTLHTGMPQVIDPATGNTIGFRINRGVRPSDTRTALEVWSDAQGSIPCDDDGLVPYGYLGWFLMTGGKVSDYTIENGAVSFSVSDMITKDGSLWGVGPYLVTTDDQGDPAPLLEPVDALDHQIVFRTTVPPPLPTIGLVPLDDPEEGEATGATAGLPGIWTPAGAVRPYDLDALQDDPVTASPNTAWTTGQHVVLGDGSFTHWDSNSWESGKA